jgi:hypothetical protein
MDCLRSFNISINNDIVFSLLDVKSWAVGAQHFFTMETDGITDISVFNIIGFKNINIYGVAVTGGVVPQITVGTNSGIIDDWQFEVILDGQLPIISGTVGTNFFGIDPNASGNKLFSLSKNTNSVKFASPFQSVKTITFNRLITQGYGLQALGSIALNYDFNFTFYYNFEGE